MEKIQRTSVNVFRRLLSPLRRTCTQISPHNDTELSAANLLINQCNLEESNSEYIENIFKKCGGFGLYQQRLSVFIFFCHMCQCNSFVSMVFLRINVPFDCYPSNFNESLVPPNITSNEFLDMITIRDKHCSVNQVKIKGDFYILPNNNSSREECKNGRKFRTKEISSIVSEFDLVCEKEWLKNIAVSILFFGCLVGALVIGVISDKFGRYKAFLLGLAIYICFLLLKIHSPNVVVFLILYFFEGIGREGSYMALFSIMFENVSEKYRMPLNFASHSIYAVGGVILAGFAYLLRDWHHLQYFVSVPHIITLLVAWKYLPESPRWLLGKMRVSEAFYIFQNIARINKKNIGTVQFLTNIDNASENEVKSDVKFIENINLRNKHQIKSKTYTVMDLIKTRKRAFISAVVWFNGFSSALLYIGVVLNSVDMPGNLYLNYFILESVEIPANILAIYLYQCFGHRKPLCFLVVFSGVNCIVSNFVPKEPSWCSLILVVFGKIGAVAAYGGIFLTSAELFPTVVRNSGMGVSSSFSRLGSIFAPIILGLSTYASWIPLSIFGVVGILAGFLLLFLPEMKDASLPQTLEDMDNL